MSGSLGTGYVALTPVNLATIPRDLEGSKAGLLTLNWATVKAVNHQYVQPINLLQTYQTGQFTTVQAILIDNISVGYPVRVVSQSTGQRVTCPAHGQVMVPLLVSVAPQFTVSLILPPGLAQPLDQVNTLLFFLNTPQPPFQISGSGNPVVGSYVQSVSLNYPAVVGGPATSAFDVTLIPAFTPGSQQIAYTSLSVAFTSFPASFPGNPSGQYGPNPYTVQLLDGATVLWQDSRALLSSAQTPYTLATTFPANLLNTDGGATVLHTIINNPLTGGSAGIAACTIAAVVTLYYSTTVPT